MANENDLSKVSMIFYLSCTQSIYRDTLDPGTSTCRGARGLRKVKRGLLAVEPSGS